MTVETAEKRAWCGAVPAVYGPHMGDGRSFRVDHPEFLSRSQSGRTIVVHLPDEAFSVLDMLLVTELEVHPPQQSPRGAAA